MRPPFHAVRSLLLAASGLTLLLAAACGGESHPVVPQHLDIPIEPAPTATHASAAAEPAPPAR
jgi:hypothetical protein